MSQIKPKTGKQSHTALNQSVLCFYSKGKQLLNFSFKRWKHPAALCVMTFSLWSLIQSWNAAFQVVYLYMCVRALRQVSEWTLYEQKQINSTYNSTLAHSRTHMWRRVNKPIRWTFTRKMLGGDRYTHTHALSPHTHVKRLHSSKGTDLCSMVNCGPADWTNYWRCMWLVEGLMSK